MKRDGYFEILAISCQNSKMARTGGNLSELKPVKTCVDFNRRIPVLSTPPIFITAKQTRNIDKQLYANVF